ncbi:hypothetical protein D5651_003157 [Escherichia coli]|nr:hypothetical protein [Escherichia coli]
MKILLTIFIYLLTAFQSANAGGIPYTFNQKILQGKVIRVLDGDTIEIKTLPAKIVVYEVPIRVRLINIDAPEKKQPFGRWSTSQLKTLVAGKQVTVSYSHKDRYVCLSCHKQTEPFLPIDWNSNDYDWLPYEDEY